MDKIETKTITISGVPKPLLDWINTRRLEVEPQKKISALIVEILYAAKKESAFAKGLCHSSGGYSRTAE